MADYETLNVQLYVGYHDANNVSNVGGDPIIWAVEISFVLRARCTIAVTRPLVLRLLLRDHAQAA